MKPIIFKNNFVFIFLLTTLCLGACEQLEFRDPQSANVEPIAEFFERAYQQGLRRSPETMSERGDSSRSGEWDDLSEQFENESHKWRLSLKQELAKFNRAELNDRDRLSFDIFSYDLQMQIEGDQFRHHAYPVNQMFGAQTRPLGLLMNIHKINSVEDARSYIARIEGVASLYSQVGARLLESEKRGIIAPKFALQLAAAQIPGIVSGKPFDNDSAIDNVIFNDFKTKVLALNLEAIERDELIAAAQRALLTKFGPAYEALEKKSRDLANRAEINGVWALPDGPAYYQYLLKRYTTTEMDAEEIHQLGLSEITRIHDQIRGIMGELGFKGSLADFFEYTQTDQRFFYPKSAEGRVRALADAEKFLGDFKEKLDDYFIVQPKSDIVVKAVEEYREAVSPVAFYNRGAPDGSRPGIYYLNLFNPKELPIWQMAPIAYHEGIPGHHMQISIGQEQEWLPSFRKFLYYSAYGEGWGLYSEYLPKETGFYKDPYDDYGRLVMELLRACRLVADTGIHHKRWTREQAIEFMLKSMPIAPERAARSVQRYFVMPGQATAYKIGQLKILSLRAKAMQRLGSDFDIRQFHDVVLTNGAVPLGILEGLVNEWIEQRQAEASFNNVVDAFWRHLQITDFSVRLQLGLPLNTLESMSFEAVQAEGVRARVWLQQLQAVPVDRLSHSNALQKKILEHALWVRAEAPKHYWTEFLITPYVGGSLVVGQPLRAVPSLPLNNAEQRRDYLALLGAFTHRIREVREKTLGQQGRGILLPKPAIDGARTMMRGQLQDAPASFMQFGERLKSVNQQERLAFVNKVKSRAAALKNELTGLLAVLDERYEQQAPEQVGLLQYPGGSDAYRYHIKRYTGLDLEPDYIHKLGRQRLAEISREQEAIRTQLGFSGSKGEFKSALLNDPRFYAETPAHVEKTYQRYIDMIAPKLADYFSSVPAAPYSVKRLLPSQEPGMTYGYYGEPSPFQKTGYYFYNGSQLADRTLLTAQHLIYHELVPGHHFHLASEQEAKNRHPMLKFLRNGAFTEGWAEYAASLGNEMGLMSDPYDRYGHLYFRAFFANRLVVDTGMNWYGWSLDEARQFMAEHTMDSATQIATETIRYSTDMPAQALNYLIGSEQIWQERKKAENILGHRFDLREFHRETVGRGSMPLDVLSQHIDWYIQQVLAAGSEKY